MVDSEHMHAVPGLKPPGHPEDVRSTHAAHLLSPGRETHEVLTAPVGTATAVQHAGRLPQLGRAGAEHAGQVPVRAPDVTAQDRFYAAREPPARGAHAARRSHSGSCSSANSAILASGADQVTVPPSGVQAAEGEGSFQGRTTIPPC